VAGVDLAAVIDDGAVEAAAAAQEVVEEAGAYGVARREPECGTALDGLGDVHAEVVEAETAAVDLVFVHADVARWKADTALQRDFPARRRVDRG
jgi:hypothetical protein